MRAEISVLHAFHLVSIRRIICSAESGPRLSLISGVVTWLLSVGDAPFSDVSGVDAKSLFGVASVGGVLISVLIDTVVKHASKGIGLSPHQILFWLCYQTPFNSSGLMALGSSEDSTIKSHNCPYSLGIVYFIVQLYYRRFNCGKYKRSSSTQIIKDN